MERGSTNFNLIENKLFLIIKKLIQRLQYCASGPIWHNFGGGYYRLGQWKSRLSFRSHFFWLKPVSLFIFCQKYSNTRNCMLDFATAIFVRHVWRAAKDSDFNVGRCCFFLWLWKKLKLCQNSNKKCVCCCCCFQNNELFQDFHLSNAGLKS